MIAAFTRFPPAVRALYTFLNQLIPLDEDRAALSQALFAFAKQFTPVEVMVIMDTNESRIFELMRSIFGYLHQQATKRFRRDQSEDLPYLGAFQTTSLLCPITQETVVDAVELSNGYGIMERGLATEFQTGLLRKTNAALCHFYMTDATECTRLSVLSGGRFKRLTHMNPMDEYYNDATDQILAPISVDAQQICNTLAMGPFAVIPPIDLGGGSRSILTLDARGFLAVFVGYKPCAAPPVKYDPQAINWAYLLVQRFFAHWTVVTATLIPQWSPNLWRDSAKLSGKTFSLGSTLLEEQSPLKQNLLRKLL
jgi:hypothetical protein